VLLIRDNVFAYTWLQTVELERESLSREVDKLNKVVKQFQNEIKTREKNERLVVFIVALSSNSVYYPISYLM